MVLGLYIIYAVYGGRLRVCQELLHFTTAEEAPLYNGGVLQRHLSRSAAACVAFRSSIYCHFCCRA